MAGSLVQLVRVAIASVVLFALSPTSVVSATTPACGASDLTEWNSGTTQFVKFLAPGSGSCRWTVPAGVSAVQYLVAGGGGGGSAGSPGRLGAGGSGGQVKQLSDGVGVPVTAGEQLEITVGAGGASSEFDGSYFAQLGGPYAPGSGESGGASSIARLGEVLVSADGGAGGWQPGIKGKGAADGWSVAGITSSFSGSAVYGSGGGAGMDWIGGVNAGSGGRNSGSQGSPGTDGFGGGGGGSFNYVSGGRGGHGTVIISYTNVPGAPTHVQVAAGRGSVQVSWVAPASSGGSPVTGYAVTAQPGGKMCTATPPATSCMVTGLTNGTAYTFTVTAENSAGVGPTSAASAAVTPRTAPGAPTHVQVAAGRGSVQVSWVAPASSGGSPVTGYAVTAQPGGKMCTATPPATNCMVTGLTNGTAYTFTVTASNAVGVGPAAASAAVAPRVPACGGSDVVQWSSGTTRFVGFVVSAAGTCRWTVPAGVSSVQYLVVGGGGGGSAGTPGNLGSGGSGGQVKQLSDGRGVTVTANEKLEITVGAGGTGSARAGWSENPEARAPSGGASSIVRENGQVLASAGGGAGARLNDHRVDGLGAGGGVAPVEGAKSWFGGYAVYGSGGGAAYFPGGVNAGSGGTPASGFQGSSGTKGFGGGGGGSYNGKPGGRGGDGAVILSYTAP